SALRASFFTYCKDFIMSVERVLLTNEAKVTMHELREQQGELMFHQRGCCDGSLPMCYKDDQFKVGRSDVKLDEVYGAPFYMAKDQFNIGTYEAHAGCQRGAEIQIFA